MRLSSLCQMSILLIAPIYFYAKTQHLRVGQYDNILYPEKLSTVRGFAIPLNMEVALPFKSLGVLGHC